MGGDWSAKGCEATKITKRKPGGSGVRAKSIKRPGTSTTRIPPTERPKTRHTPYDGLGPWPYVIPGANRNRKKQKIQPTISGGG